jgi:acetolactate synthase-1/2/3 large subunit
MVGMHGSAAANRAMHDADTVFAAGVRFDDRATGSIRQFCPDAKIIHVDIDAAEVNKILPAYCAIIADAESVLPVVAVRIAELKNARGGARAGTRSGESAPEASRSEWMAGLARLRDADAASFRETFERAERASGIANPELLIASIPARAKAFGLDPEDIIVTTDVGQHQMWTAQWYPFARPRQFLTSGSLGTMGFGLPAAIGAALANPGKRIVCVSGDGSIMMNIQELATLAELGLDVTVIVLDNGALGMVRQQQELLFAKNFSACVYDHSPDLVRIAEGFGIQSVDEASAGWDEVAFGGKGPRFVRCLIEQDENVWPFVPSGKANVDALMGKA